MGLVKKQNIDMLDAIATYQQFNDVLTLIPDKTRILMKVFGPLMTTYMKVDMALQSLNKTFGASSKPVDELGDAMEESGEKVEKQGGIMGAAMTVLTIPFKAFGGTVKFVGKMFKSLLLGILPLLGIIMALIGIVMLVVAAFDKGGGSLKTWLEDLPIAFSMQRAFFRLAHS